LAEFTTLHPRYHKLIKSQEAIGWDHLVRGCFSKLWAESQQDYIYCAHHNTKFDAAKWHCRLINTMLVDCHNLRTLRNEERHGKEQTQKRTKCLEQLERDLLLIFKLESEVLASDRNTFPPPMAQLLTLPPGEITKWIASRRPIILHSRCEARRRSTTSVKLLPTYFHPLRRPFQIPPRRLPRRRSNPDQLPQTTPMIV
jgi:hypothetical protein